jgi:hypothetical protein
MKVGDVVKRTNPRSSEEAAARYLLVEHHGDAGTIKPVGDASAESAQRVDLVELALAENAPLVVEPWDD